MPLFRQKPVVVEAIRWDGTMEGSGQIRAALGSAIDIEHGLVCRNPAGNVRARPGDWIFKNAEGEVYPADPDLFATTYEAVAEDGYSELGQKGGARVREMIEAAKAAEPAESAWTPFWWESNACWGAVDCDTDWQAMVAEYARKRGGLTLGAASTEMLDAGAVATWTHPTTFEASGRVSIGTRREHIGGTPFRTWAKDHGLDLDLAHRDDPVPG